MSSRQNHLLSLQSDTHALCQESISLDVQPETQLNTDNNDDDVKWTVKEERAREDERRVYYIERANDEVFPVVRSFVVENNCSCLRFVVR